MTAKKPDVPPSSDGEQTDMQEIERKIKRMLDPAEPDSEPDQPPDSAVLQSEENPATAPEVASEKPSKAKAASPIAIQSEDDGEYKFEVVKKEDADTKSEPDPVPASEPEAGAPEEGPLETDTEKPDRSEKPQQADMAEESSDTETAKAVDEIIAEESDALLAAEDEKHAKSIEEKKKPSLTARLKGLLGAWWHNRAARRATFAILILIVVAAMVTPVSRYFMLNTFGVRSAASIKILDESTRQPLKNVQVSLRGQKALTDDEGVARLTELKLGSTELVIEKRAFAPIKRQVTLGWGSNPLGDASLTPVGSQYVFGVSDYLSGQPIKKAEATSGEASAFSDENGQIKLTLDKTDDTPFEVSITGDGLRTEKLLVDPNNKAEHTLQMAPNRKHTFISKRSGRFDVYKIDADGKNEELVLSGTGNERDDILLVPHPKDELVALVSTRSGARNSQGFLLSTLLLIDLSDNSTVEVAQSERVQVLDWVGDKLVYVRVAAGSSAANPARHRLMTYDVKTYESSELASSNFFNDVTIAKGLVYYAPSSAYQNGQTAFYRIGTDGNNRQAVLDQETWSIFRTGYHNLTLAIGQDWYDYNLGNNKPTKLGGEPANLRNRSYVDSPDGKRSLWVDQRDGKGVLLTYDLEGNEDTQVFERSGLRTPIRWLNDRSVVFRVNTDQETADYAASLDGGEPKKIRDVTDTNGVEAWYYY